MNPLTTARAIAALVLDLLDHFILRHRFHRFCKLNCSLWPTGHWLTNWYTDKMAAGSYAAACCDQCGYIPFKYLAHMYQGESADYSTQHVCLDCALSVVDENDGSFVTLFSSSAHLSFDQIEAEDHA